MATVQGPLAANQPLVDRKAAAQRTARSYQNIQPVPHSKADPFYGHEVIARLCTRFITHLFACPENPPTQPQTQAKLPYFIAYALHRTKLHVSVTFAALVLLQRLKARFPTARGSSGHRLFISAFMIASKVICDDTYSNKSWGIVAQGMFTLREINQMEREMCSYLDWELTVDNPILENFENMVRHDFATKSTKYPTYSLQMVSKRAAKAAASASATPIPEPHTTTTSPIPMFGQRYQTPTKAVEHQPPPQRLDTTMASATGSYPNSPMTPSTPSASYSNNTSPAPSASPQTPVGPVDNTARIYTETSPKYSLAEYHGHTHPLKNKMFASAVPITW